MKDIITPIMTQVSTQAGEFIEYILDIYISKHICLNNLVKVTFQAGALTSLAPNSSISENIFFE